MAPSLATIVRPGTGLSLLRRIGWPAGFPGKCLWLVVGLACISFCPAEEKKTPELELAFKLRDSSSIQGVPTVQKLPFQSALADMVVPLEMLSNVEFKDDRKTAILHFKNGDRLEGLFRLETLGVKTAYGKLEVGFREMVSFQVCGVSGNTGSAPSEGLVGHWPLDGNANDVSGNGHHGKVIGATPTRGFSGGAYHFDGNAGIDLGPVDFSKERFTVSGWIRTDEPAATECWRTWISKLDDSGGPFALELGDGRSNGGNNGPQALVWEGRTTPVVLTSHDIRQSLRDGRWHMFTFTYQTGSQNAYVDGKLFASDTFPGPLPSNQASVRIGGHHIAPYHHPWVGDVGEVLIYNRVLSGDEIMQLFQTQRPANASSQP